MRKQSDFVFGNAHGASIMIHRIALVFSLVLAGSVTAEPIRATYKGMALTEGVVHSIYQAAVKKNDPIAMYNMGNLAERGVGVRQSDQDAFDWFYRAASAGHVGAMNALGIAYATGEGVTRNPILALRWLLKAADNGSGEAMGNLGVAYFIGEGVPTNYRESARWFAKASALGNASAMNNLALMYEKGMGVSYNPDSAMELFKQAARAGFPLAMKNLGVLYEAGNTTAKSHLDAYAWIEAALESGLQGEDRDDAAYELGVIALELRSDELARARQLANRYSAPIAANHKF